MTTQGSTYPDTTIPARKSSDGRTASETIEAAGSDLKARASELLEKGRNRASEIYESGKARASDMTDGVQDGIRAKPIQSVLIAAAVGALIGVIIGRRSA